MLVKRFAKFNRKEKERLNLLKKIAAGSVVLAPLGAFATSTTPLDLTATGTTVAGYVGQSALAGLAVFAAIYGIRVIMKAFKAVGK